MLGADATLWEPNRPKLVQLEIPLARLPSAWDGFRIAQLSDFHYDPYFSAIPIRKAVAIVNRLQVDLVLLTGDFVSIPTLSSHVMRAAAAIDPCVGLLRELRSRLGSLAILGNHDVATDPERVITALQAEKIPVLRNRSLALEQGGARLWIAGIDDATEGDPDLGRTLQGIPPNEPVVLMAHEPDFVEQIGKYAVDLQLSGHSHGGQVRLPLLGAPVLPTMARLYPWGLHHVGQTTLYTNVGIGTVIMPVRFNCPPEITLITLRAGKR